MPPGQHQPADTSVSRRTHLPIPFQLCIDIQTSFVWASTQLEIFAEKGRSWACLEVLDIFLNQAQMFTATPNVVLENAALFSPSTSQKQHKKGKAVEEGLFFRRSMLTTALIISGFYPQGKKHTNK